MKLKYKILWFEDDSEVVKLNTEQVTIGKEIFEYLEYMGFEPMIHHEKNGKSLEEILSKDVFDLIVSDLNLGEFETGDKLVEHIRKQSIFTEVLLYSANISDINKIIENNGRIIERISFAVGLKNLPTKLKNIISLSIKKVQDINNMRGLVIAEVIDLEIKIEDVVKKFFEIDANETLDEHRQGMFQEICEKRVSRFEKDFEENKEIYNCCIDHLIESDILTASNVYEAVQSIIKEDIKNINLAIEKLPVSEERKAMETERDKLKSLKLELNKFSDEIIKLRNTLAHVQEKHNAQGVSYLESINKNGTTIIFDDEKYIEIRKTLKKHSENLKQIQSHIYDGCEVRKKAAAASDCDN